MTKSCNTDTMKAKHDSVKGAKTSGRPIVSINPLYLRKSSADAPSIYPAIHIESGICSGPIHVDDVDVRPYLKFINKSKHVDLEELAHKLELAANQIQGDLTAAGWVLDAAALLENAEFYAANAQSSDSSSKSTNGNSSSD